MCDNKIAQCRNYKNIRLYKSVQYYYYYYSRLRAQDGLNCMTSLNGLVLLIIIITIIIICNTT